MNAHQRSSALTTPAIDFWLLGGASIVLWALMFTLQGEGRSAWAVDHHFVNLLAVSGSVALVGNYPHFMASYKLAYGQGASFVAGNWFQLILVPIALIVSLAGAYLTFDVATPGGALPSLNALVRALGLPNQLGLAPTMGKEIMNILLQVMFFTVGWHYAKQTYGCMRVMAHFDGYTLAPRQWALVRMTLFSVWFCSFAWANTGDLVRDSHGIDYVTLGLPPWLNLVAMIFFAYMLSASLLMFRDQKRVSGRWPGTNTLVAPVAFILWWLPIFVQTEFYLWIVPFFHSVQYLTFVYKIERSRGEAIAPHDTSIRGGVLGLALVAAGFVAFELAPNSIDHWLNTQDRLGVWFFFAAAALFINVHHYFIDNVIWRFQNPGIRKHLLS